MSRNKSLTDHVKECLIYLTLAAQLLSPSCATIQQRPVNKDKQESAATLEDKIVHPRNIGYVALDIEKEAGFEVTDEEYALLDKIMQEAGEKIGQKTIYTKDDGLLVLKEIGKIIRDNGFKIGSGVFLFSAGLKNKEIDCSDLTNIYLAIGEKYGLPLVPVSGPRHRFIRLQLPDGKYINWECTSREELTNDDYIRWFGIHLDSITSGVYLRSVPREEFIWTFFATVGLAKSEMGDLDSAIANYNKAIRLNPKDADTYHNRGNVKFWKDDLEGAIADYDNAIELNPNFVDAYYGRGLAKKYRGDLDEAEEDFQMYEKLTEGR